MTITLTCPNEDCEAEYEVRVVSFGRGRPATLWDPAEPVELEVEGPSVCACGESLDTIAQHALAIRTAAGEATDAALACWLDHREDRR